MTVAGRGPVQDNQTRDPSRGVRNQDPVRPAMRPLVLTLLLAPIAAIAAGPLAYAEPPRAPRGSMTARMTCAEAMALVKREGDIMIAAGNAPERLVRDRNQCELSEISELRFVPTRDNPQCPIGYRCREPGFEEWNW